MTRTTINVNDDDWKNLEKKTKRQGFTSRNEYIGHLISSDLNSNTENPKNLDTTLKKYKIADLKLKIWDKVKNAGYTLEQLEQILNGDELPRPETKTIYSEPIVESNPTPKEIKHQFKAQGETTTNKPNEIKQEDGTLRCRLCNKKIDMRAFHFEQLNDYRIHFETTHRKLTDEERAELMELY